jgi:hypothetical protein
VIKWKEKRLIDREKHAEGNGEGEVILQETHFMSYAINELERIKEESVVGYMAINLYNPPPEATWGHHNDRKISTTWVETMVNAFKQRCSNCNEESCIEIAIRPEWLENRDKILAKVNGMNIKDVPVMKFTEEGKAAISPDNLIMLGGNHRREALHAYVDWLQKQIQSDEQVLKGKGADGEAGKDIDVLKSRVKLMKEMAKESCFWAVKIYDRGE